MYEKCNTTRGTIQRLFFDTKCILLPEQQSLIFLRKKTALLEVQILCGFTGEIHLFNLKIRYRN